jgi:sucrose-phosphate synthase
LEALSDLGSRLALQPATEQGPFKLSYVLRPPLAGVLEMVRQRLLQRRLEARAHCFQHWFVDVLPVRASKPDAIRHLSLQWGIPLEQVLVVASQQGDAALLNGRTLGVVLGDHDRSLEGLRRRPKVFFASNRQAWGVLEGLEHYRFLRG